MQVGSSLHRAMSTCSKSFKVVVVGGGAGGLAVAARFAKKLPGQVAVIEPASAHYYQPLWTLVGGGLKDREDSARPMGSVMPSGAEWLQTGVEGFMPEENAVKCRDGCTVNYEHLVVAPGIKVAPEKVKGLQEALDDADSGVSTNYLHNYVNNTWTNIQKLTAAGEGKALFTHPAGPVKCAGAPQKILYIAEDHFRRHGVRKGMDMRFVTALPKMFGVPKYNDVLTRIVNQRGIAHDHGFNLVEVDAAGKTAHFERVAGEGEVGERMTQTYDMLHASPPMTPHRFVAESPLADATGFVEVDKHTTRHVKYGNVWSVGDASNMPNSKTAAAVSAQAAALKVNLEKVMAGGEPTEKYDGYASCPLVTGKGKLVLAEFDYDLQPLETFPFDQGKELESMYLLKAEAMPPLYWEGLLKDRWPGPGMIRQMMSPLAMFTGKANAN
jgi:sulfide:quinone oxidoreductase